ncbi:Prenylated rab acceptor PRA1 [Dillenia turbinata]|uniref:Prenylated rab acceptor PRA1 n=1 Tax=Dillenia turbinata TaxID=194707 RepID=A0AAN8UGK2_9MAGN
MSSSNSFTSYNAFPLSSQAQPTKITPMASSPPASTSETTNLISFAKHRVQSAYSSRRPWRQLVDLSAFSKPSNYNDALVRIRKNLIYFRANYTLIVLFIVFLSLLWHPISMIVFLILFVAWLVLYFSRDEPLILFGSTVDDRVVLCGLGLITILALVFTSVGLNVLVSLIIAAILIGLHGAFRGTEDLFLDESEAAGFFGEFCEIGLLGYGETSQNVLFMFGVKWKQFKKFALLNALTRKEFNILVEAVACKLVNNESCHASHQISIRKCFCLEKDGSLELLLVSESLLASYVATIYKLVAKGLDLNMWRFGRLVVNHQITLLVSLYGCISCISDGPVVCHWFSFIAWVLTVYCSDWCRCSLKPVIQGVLLFSCL